MSPCTTICVTVPLPTASATPSPHRLHTLCHLRRAHRAPPCHSCAPFVRAAAVRGRTGAARGHHWRWRLQQHEYVCSFSALSRGAWLHARQSHRLHPMMARLPCVFLAVRDVSGHVCGKRTAPLPFCLRAKPPCHHKLIISWLQTCSGN